MTILFAQNWDVRPNKFDEYSAFVTNEYNPALEKLGLELLGGYYVAVGEGPRITAVVTIERTGGVSFRLALRNQPVAFIHGRTV